MEIRLGIVRDEVCVRAMRDHALVNGVERPGEDDESLETPVIV